MIGAGEIKKILILPAPFVGTQNHWLLSLGLDHGNWLILADSLGKFILLSSQAGNFIYRIGFSRKVPKIRAKSPVLDNPAFWLIHHIFWNFGKDAA